MIRQTYTLDIITPCFCSGADQSKAEIRAPSIRGQLRWWFRVLGGFKSLAPMGLREQENMIFGSAAGDEGTAGLLTVRVANAPTSDDVRDDVRMDATVYNDRGYFLWPLRTVQGVSKSRAAINADVVTSPACPSFSLHILWPGNPALMSSLQALITIFGNLGSLGFRSRRAMGALSLTSNSSSLTLIAALDSFSAPQNITLTSLTATSPTNAIDVLAQWLKKWRAHGRSIDLRHGTSTNKKPPYNAGWGFAQSDHDAADLHIGPGYRPALGMPMMAKYGDWSAESPPAGKQIKGRFASPVLLRPHRAADRTWRALIIFIDNRQWGYITQDVYLTPNRQPTQTRRVSGALYNAMKADTSLTAFP